MGLFFFLERNGPIMNKNRVIQIWSLLIFNIYFKIVHFLFNIIDLEVGHTELPVQYLGVLDPSRYGDMCLLLATCHHLNSPIYYMHLNQIKSKLDIFNHHAISKNKKNKYNFLL